MKFLLQAIYALLKTAKLFEGSDWKRGIKTKHYMAELQRAIETEYPEAT
jgi:hypothetical protein